MASYAVLALAVTLFGLSSAKPDPVVITARCPEVCQPVGLAFAGCARFQFAGCTMAPCVDDDGKMLGTFQCLIDEQDTGIVVTPGGDIVLDKVQLYDFFKVKVDLNAAAVAKTDVYLLSDATGSMGTAIATAKSKFQDIVDHFVGTGSDSFFGVGFFRDESELTNGFKNLVSITSDVAAVKAGIDTLSARGGGDGDEANLAALYRLATDPRIGWRKDARKLIVYFGDFPGHEPTCVGGKSINRHDVIKALDRKSITVVGTSFGGGMDRVPSRYGCGRGSRAGPNQASEIAEATGGTLVPVTNQAKLIEEIINGVKALPKTFNIDTSDCDDKLAVTTDPKLPVTLKAGASATVQQKMQILIGSCAGAKSFECQLKYTERGAALPPSTVKVLDVEGCPF